MDAGIRADGAPVKGRCDELRMRGSAPVVGTVTPAGVLPADCEGELRELAALLDRNYSPACAKILLSIVARYSSVRPMRTGKAP